MLGYVRAFKPDLRMSEYELYKGVYCSLCRRLGKNYSPIAQLFLSYDFALAALVRLAVSDEKCVFVKGHCPYNPAKRCLNCQSTDVFDLCAHAVIITVYYKLIDNLRDRGFWSRIGAGLLLPIVSLMHGKAKRKAPEIDSIVAHAMKLQAQAEKAEKSLDEAAHPSADALGEILACGVQGDEHAMLYSFGYMTGRYVYILDAADDLEDDIKKGNYNPFAAKAHSLSTQEGRSKFSQHVTGVLNLTQSEAVNALGSLKVRRFASLLENIVYDGLCGSADRVLAKYTGEDKKQKQFVIQ